MAIDRDQGLRLDKDATKIALGYTEGYDPVCLAIAPQIKVASNGQYPVYAAGAWLYQEDSLLAQGARSVKEFIPPVESWTAYNIEPHALKAFVSGQTPGNSAIVQGMVYSDVKVAAKAVTFALQQAWSYKVATTVVATAYAAAASQKWDTAGATPWADFVTGVTAFKNQIGRSPLGCIIPDRAMWHLGDGARAKYSHTGNMSNYEIVEKLLLRDLNIEKLYVTDVEYTSSGAFTPLWGKNVILFRSATNPNGFQPSYMGSLVPDNKNFIEVFQPYWNEDMTGQFVQVRMHYLVKELDAKAVYMISSVIS